MLSLYPIITTHIHPSHRQISTQSNHQQISTQPIHQLISTQPNHQVNTAISDLPLWQQAATNKVALVDVTSQVDSK